MVGADANEGSIEREAADTSEAAVTSLFLSKNADSSLMRFFSFFFKEFFGGIKTQYVGDI